MAITDQASTAPTVAHLRDHSLTGVVQHEIERMILSGAFPAGSRLNENALAAKLAVSRGPIREACRALVELGMLQLIPNRGVFVKRLDRADAVEVYDIRSGMTGLAASLLAPILTAQHIAELEGFLAEMEQAAEAEDFGKFYPLNLEFHDYIVRSTGNGRLTKMYRGLVKEFHLFRSHGLVQRDALLASNREHREIVEALKARDPQVSYDVSFRHVANGKRRMLMALEVLAQTGAAASREPQRALE
jgi:DNA-binding GntR family transcriptional regulator